MIAALALPFAAYSDVTVEANQNLFTGLVRFKDVNGDAYTKLNTYFKMNNASIFAVGATKNYNARITTITSQQIDPSLGRQYQLPAEADDKGVGSVVYNLFASASFGVNAVGNLINFFTFDSYLSPNSLTLSKMPAPSVVANFEECVGIIEVNFSDICSAPTTALSLIQPYIVSPGSLTQFHGTSSVMRHIAKPALNLQDFTLHYSVGTDPYSNLNQFEIKFQATASCNVVTPICLDKSKLPGTDQCVGAGCPPTGLGRIVGQWDILNTLENANNRRTQVEADQAIYGNYRLDDIGGEPGSPNPPINPLGTARTFDLENLVVSPYQVHGQTSTGANRAYNFITTNRHPSTTMANQTNNLGSVFFMNKAEFYGDVWLTHSPKAGQPSSALNDLYFSDAQNVNGVPTSLDLSTGSRIRFNGSGASSITAWPFDTAHSFRDDRYGQIKTNQLHSNYKALVARANNLSTVWPDNGETYLELRFDADALVDGSNPPRANGNLMIMEKIAQAELKHQIPTDTREVNFRYCFGTVKINYKNNSGSLFRPVASITGHHNGNVTPLDPTDNFKQIFDRQANYRVFGTFYGVPQFQNPSMPVNSGELWLLLPKGTFTVKPSITVSGGGVTDLPSETFPLECDQHVTIPMVPCDADGDGDIDKNDLTLISRARGSTPFANDPRDANKDGRINAADVKACIPNCTRANCAP